MGYEVYYVSIEKIDSEYYYRLLDESYFTYNFSILENKQQKCIWNFKKDMVGLHSSIVIKNIQKTFAEMDKEGIKVGIPDLDNPSWGWGCDIKTRLPYIERCGVLRYHLCNFLKILKKHPVCYVTSDYKTDITLLDGKIINYETIKEIEEEEKLTYYYRHPFKGNFKVNTFKKALEVYGILSSTGDSRADKWYDIAFEMNDAP